MPEKKTLLAFGAHMDDPELGCGGTLLRAARHGHRVICAVVCGRFHNFRTLDCHRPEDLVARNNAVMEKYGFEPKRFLDFEYMELNETWEAKKVFSDVIQETKPDVVFSHTRHDRWADHNACGRIVEHAAMFSHLYTNTEFHRPEIYFYETSATQTYASRFRPDVFIDISDVIDDAIEMLAPHDDILSAHLGPNGTGKAPIFAEVDLHKPKSCQMTLTAHGMMKFLRCGARALEVRMQGFVEAFESLYPVAEDDRLLYQIVKG